MSLDANKALVRRYFRDVMDAGQTELVYEMFSSDCRVQYPHQPEPRVSAEVVASSLAEARARQTSMVTHIELLMAEDDLVAARVRHDVVFNSDIPSRNGTLKATGRSVSWLAHVIFRIRDGRIAEQWVQRDEAGILEQLDALPAPGA
jgi:predicted ester cyclase